MTDAPQDSILEVGFEQFEYRLVYLQPSDYSDERIAVGVVASSRDRLEARFVSSVSSLDLMARIFGEEGVEQFHFAAGELRRTVSRADGLDSLAMPTDLFVVGEKIAAFTKDRTGLLTNILSSASCLVRANVPRAAELSNTPQQGKLWKTVFDEVSLLSPLTAKDLFNRKVVVETGEAIETVELPIFGTRIFGAPVLFSSASSEQRVRAESYVARFNWLQKYLSQRPRMYLLTPHERGHDLSERADSNLRELHAVADASNVPLRIADSARELATLIVQDEAA